MKLANHVAIITGAGRGIGKQTALVLAEAGANIILAARSVPEIEAVADEIRALGRKALAIPTDVTQKPQVESMVKKTYDAFGKVDILINNAGLARHNLIPDIDEQDWDDQIAVNLKGTFLCTQAVFKQMCEQKYGNIINISSTYGIIAPDQRIYGTSGQNSSAFYASTKSALINLTRYLASYWNRKGIRVNTFSPGGVENNQDPKFIKKYSEKTMIGRMAKKDEYIGAVIFLCSDASSYMTGSNLIIDGGWTAW